MPDPVVVDLLPESIEDVAAAAAVPQPATAISSSVLPASPSPPPLSSTATPSPPSLPLEKPLPRTPPELESRPNSQTRPRARPSVTVKIPKRGWRNSTTMSKTHGPPNQLTTDVQEYEALPPSIQRKYFSSLERLRIAEHAAQQRHQHQQSKTRPLARFPGPVVVTKTTSPIDGRPRPWTQRGNSRSRKLPPFELQRDCTISHAEAQWFLSLPEKVRRQQFSREEQVLLAGGLDTYCFYPADEKANYGITIEGDYESDPDYDPSFVSEKRGCVVRSPSSASLRKHSSTRDDSEALFIDTMSPPPQALSQRPRRSSMRRTLSATNVPFSPFRQSTSSSPSVPSSSNSRRPLLRPRAQSSAMPSAFDASKPLAEAPAKHYQDPDARQKLKTYLGSAQKFDEAIEFGFPSTHADAPRAVKETVEEEPKPKGLVSYDVEKFLRDEVLSCMESHAGDYSDYASARSDADTEGDLDSPVTPSDVAQVGFRHHGRSNFSSLDSTGLPPSWPNLKQFPQDPHSDLFSGAREMTLRMTLTRPDLRANEEELYGWQHSAQSTPKDPLALQALPAFTDDVDGSHGPFCNGNRRSSLIGRIIGKIKKKN